MPANFRLQCLLAKCRFAQHYLLGSTGFQDMPGLHTYGLATGHYPLDELNSLHICHSSAPRDMRYEL